MYDHPVHWISIAAKNCKQAGLFSVTLKTICIVSNIEEAVITHIVGIILFITCWRQFYFAIPGGKTKNGTVDTVNFQDFALINSYLFSPCWIEHLFFIITTPRSSNLVENFLFYKLFLYGLSFSGFARFQKFRGMINDKLMANPENDSP